MEQANVVEQLKHLVTYPFVQERVAAGTLTLSGWHYIIETGEISIYDRKAGEFVVPIEMNSLSMFTAYYDKLEKQLSRFE